VLLVEVVAGLGRRAVEVLADHLMEQAGLLVLCLIMEVLGVIMEQATVLEDKVEIF
jgi:hypothetical protein